MNSNQNNERQS